MTHSFPPKRFWKIGVISLVLLLVPLGVGGYVYLTHPVSTPPPDLPMPPAATEATAEQVQRVCAGCHAYPPPETLPRAVWRKEVKQGYDFLFKDPRFRGEFPSLESVALYYEKRAPQSLPWLDTPPPPTPPAVRFERRGFPMPDPAAYPGVSHVKLVHLFNDQRPEILVCDALQNQVLVLKPYTTPPSWQVLAAGYCCAHAEVLDLDGDGVKDVLLAGLGNFFATDDRAGSVIWLKGAKDGTFTPITLLDGVGRVADVQAVDCNQDGKLDLIVAVFGWREVGEILYLENHTSDWSRPRFAAHRVDDRHGTTHVPVGDVNGDGRPDFVALISQEHETVVAFLSEPANRGGGVRFRKETLYAAPHPTFGCSGIQLVDLDGDSDLDVLLANGDALDAPFLLKPYHGVQWLENRQAFPFIPHRLTDLYGAGSPVAGDVDGDGDLDIVVVSFLLAEYYPQRQSRQLEAVVLLEQTERGKFVRHPLEQITCDYLSCALGDVDGDGKADLVTGTFHRGTRQGDAVAIWRNLGRKRD